MDFKRIICSDGSVVFREDIGDRVNKILMSIPPESATPAEVLTQVRDVNDEEVIGYLILLGIANHVNSAMEKNPEGAIVH
jgi:hypothetical protein